MTDIEYLKKYLDKDKIEDGLKKLEQGIPVQYIVGNVDFYTINVDVDENVLIPRFETEELVDYTIKYIKKYFNENIKILDIGTGSGCIALSLKDNLKDAYIDACDISDKALEIAQKNSKKNNLNVHFIQSDIFENIKEKYDVIISNPPYIAYDEEIMDIVKNNEPHQALYADNNGLYFYEQILENAKKYLKEKNIIAFEIGYKQANDIEKIANKYFPNSKIIVKKDLQQKDRFVFILNID